MWTRKHVLFGIGVVVVLEICVQMLFPYDRALPLATVGSVRAGFSSRSDLARIFQEQFENSKVELKSGDRVITTSLTSLGATLGSDQMAARLTEYPLWQRLLPGSIIVRQPHIASLQVSFDGKQVAEKVATVASQLTYNPTDAAITIKEGKLEVGVAKNGNIVAADDVAKTLVTAVYHAGITRVIVPSKTVVPTRSDGDVAAARQQANQALGRTITVSFSSKDVVTPDAATKASWLAIDLTSKPAALSVNRDAVRGFVATMNDRYKVPAIPTTVTVVDGIEQQRRGGTSGAELAIDTITDQIAKALLGQASTTISATLQPVSPPLVYTRSYSHSQAGLQAYVAYATSTQNVRIVVQQLDGPGWSASGRAEESIPSASTYKLFVMLRVFDDINAGGLTWDSPMLDTTVGGCFERTIVPSTNPCAEEWIRQYGRDSLNDYVHSKGFSMGTGFTFSDATHTTAGDLAKYLIGLNNGTLVSGNNRDMLLEKMSRQLYRYGIPTGTKGWAQDKVGFLWDYIHDVAIVHNPQGSYVMVIMTKGYSYGYIANVARQIDTILYP